MKEPRVLSENVFFWRPRRTSGKREESEERVMAEVATFFRSAGFNVSEERRDGTHWLRAEKGGAVVDFTHWEGVRVAQKRLRIEIDGMKSGLEELRTRYGGQGTTTGRGSLE